MNERNRVRQSLVPRQATSCELIAWSYAVTRLRPGRSMPRSARSHSCYTTDTCSGWDALPSVCQLATAWLSEKRQKTSIIVHYWRSLSTLQLRSESHRICTCIAGSSNSPFQTQAMALRCSRHRRYIPWHRFVWLA